MEAEQEANSCLNKLFWIRQVCTLAVKTVLQFWGTFSLFNDFYNFLNKITYSLEDILSTDTYK